MGVEFEESVESYTDYCANEPETDLSNAGDVSQGETLSDMIKKYVNEAVAERFKGMAAPGMISKGEKDPFVAGLFR